MDAPSAIITPESWTEGLPLDELFPARQPLEVEVGCGKGRFLTAMAARQPEHNFLGIDRLLARIRKVDKKARRGGLTNVRLLRLEASYTLQYLLPETSVSVYHIFFPDPWPKRKHHRRRLFNATFLDTLNRTLVKGGRLNVATDHLDYYAEIRRLFASDRRFTEVEAFVPPEDAVSEFEQIFRSQDLPIGRASYIKGLPMDMTGES